MSGRGETGGMEKTEPTRRRNPYRIRAGRVWALIRPRYLRGESAPRLAEVFNVTEYAIRQRIRRPHHMGDAEACGPDDIAEGCRVQACRPAPRHHRRLGQKTAHGRDRKEEASDDSRASG